MVVDGQQRLTTLSLMYVVRDIFDQTYRDYPNLNFGYQFSGKDLKLSEIGDYLTEQIIGTEHKPKLLPENRQRQL